MCSRRKLTVKCVGNLQRKPRRAGLGETRRGEAAFLPSAYFEEITISPFRKSDHLPGNIHPFVCRLFIPPLLYSQRVSLQFHTQTCARWCRTDNTAWHRNERPECLGHCLVKFFWAFFAQLSLCGTSGVAKVFVTDKDWVYKG